MGVCSVWDSFLLKYVYGGEVFLERRSTSIFCMINISLL